MTSPRIDYFALPIVELSSKSPNEQTTPRPASYLPKGAPPIVVDHTYHNLPAASRPSRRLIQILGRRALLRRVLDLLSYDDFHALAYSNRFMKRFFDGRFYPNEPHRVIDVVMARFVPGYKPSQMGEDFVKLDLAHLQALSESAFVTDKSMLWR